MGGVAVVYRVVRETLTESDRALEEEREQRGYLRGRAFQPEGMCVQRPWGRTVGGVLEERQGGPCGWSRVSKKGERERERGGDDGREGKWQVLQGLAG